MSLVIDSQEDAIAGEQRVVAYDIDTAHTRAHFKVRHLTVAYVRGDWAPGPARCSSTRLTCPAPM